MKRREFITLLGSAAAAAWPLAARAQQRGKLPTIGFLGSGTPAAQSQWAAALVQRLRELGWIEGDTAAPRLCAAPTARCGFHSFAHGRTIYELKLDAREAMAALEKARDPDKAFIELALSADLDDAEIEYLRNQASKRSGTGKRTLTGMLTSARKEQTKRTEQELRDWEASLRNDPRPPIPAPKLNAPWLPVMDTINEVLSRSARPPWRDMDCDLTQARLLRIPDMHAFTTAEVNANDLPPPEQWLLSKQNEMEAAETIERHIDYIGDYGSVHLGMPFVTHYMNRHDDALNTLVAISLVPLVLPSGELLNLDGYGFDAERGILFKDSTSAARHRPEARRLHREDGAGGDDVPDRRMAV